MCHSCRFKANAYRNEDCLLKPIYPPQSYAISVNSYKLSILLQEYRIHHWRWCNRLLMRDHRPDDNKGKWSNSNCKIASKIQDPKNYPSASHCPYTSSITQWLNCFLGSHPHHLTQISKWMLTKVPALVKHLESQKGISCQVKNWSLF